MPDEGYTRDIDYAIKDLLFIYFCLYQATVNGHKYSSPSILRYIFHIKPHFSIFFYCEVISKRILMIFAPEEAELFKD